MIVSEEVKRAYQEYHTLFEQGAFKMFPVFGHVTATLADALRDTLARALKAEHDLSCEHYAAVEMFMCEECKGDWLAEADKQLREES